MPLVIIIVVIAALGVAVYAFFAHRSGEPRTHTVPIIRTEGGIQLKLTADSADVLGVDTDTTFTLTSSQPIDLASVEGNLQVAPSFDYTVQSSGTNVFTITPAKLLDGNTVYKFSMASQASDETQKREYEWAYQTKDTFKVMTTVPRDQATSVPLDTGIEIVFSHENYKDYEQYVSISPTVVGHFEQYRKMLVYVPDSLSPATVYTVTVKAGLPLDGSDQMLAADYQFQFETDQAKENYGYFRFTKDFFEYPTTEAPVLTANEYNSGLTKAPVSVYAFGSFPAFADAVKTMALLPAWARYAWDTHAYPTNSLTLQSAFDAEIKTIDYRKYIEFPETIPAGYYLVQVQYGDQITQAFLQVGKLIASYESSTDNSFIWVHDLVTRAPVSGALIGYSGDESLRATTDADGLATFATPASLAVTSNDDSVGLSYFTVQVNGDDLLVPVERYYGYDYYYDTASRDYWTYAYTNRTLYSPNDSVKFWGVVKPRGSVPGPQGVTVTFVKTANYITGSTDEVIATKEVPVSDYGTFEGSIDYQMLNPGYYRLNISDKGGLITTQYVQIATYTKPAYKIDVDSPKRAIFEGDDAVFNITTEFYDGTPVGDLELQYTGALGGGTITTDANGKAQVVLATSQGGETYYPQYQYFSIHPTNPELADIYTDAYLYVFGPRYTIDASVDQNGTVSGNAYQVDLTSINASADHFVWEYQGDPVAGAAVTAKVYHNYYTKTETGSRYDIISKKTYKTYDYQSHSDLVTTLTAVTDDRGGYQANFTPEADENYEIKVNVTDQNGREATTATYLYHRSAYNSWITAQGYDEYHVALDDSDQASGGSFKPGDEISASLYRNDEIVSDTAGNNILFFKGQAKLFDLTPTSHAGISFTFQDSYAPNVYLYGLYFDGREYHLASSLALTYDRTLKELNIQLTPDQPTYKPGSAVTLGIHVTDHDNRPVRATVNVSAIDEALTAIQWNNPAMILSTLYRGLPPPIIYSYQTHESALSPMAERGGCFSGDTTILMADGTTKPIADIRIGDSIATHPAPSDVALVPATVTNTYKHIVTDYLVINKSLRVTPEHIVFLNGSWQMIGDAQVGDWLQDSQSGRVVIDSISRHYDPLTVYNLTTDPYHTFIADGIYVHNEKGGGRQNFQDIAYFGSTTTDRSGNASVTFTLPDNITSWQTTVHALTSDLRAQATQTAIIATQPYFVDVAVADDYVVGDKPQVLVRSFGLALDENSPVAYSVTFPGYSDDTVTRQAGANDTVAIDMPDFASGAHKIRVEGKQGKNSDAVIKTITYRDSHITAGTTNYFRLDVETPLTGSTTGRTSLVFTNLERGQFYRNLRQLSWSYGDRVEQQLGRYQAQALLNEYFAEQGSLPSITFTNYQVPEGGISLLPYSGAELLTTAKVVGLAPELFDTLAAKDYFENILLNRNSRTDEVVYALLGLANLDEPVLTDINIFLSRNDVAPELKLYLARAVAKLGATEYAANMLQDVLDKYGNVADPYIEVQLGKTQDDYTEFTYQAAILAAAVSSDQAPKLYAFALAHPAVTTLNTIDELEYIQTALPLLSADPVSFSYTLDGQTKDVSLKNADTYALSITPDQLASIAFSNISGQIGAVTAYQQPVDLSSAPTDSHLGISRVYTVNGKRATTFHANDVVMVTLKPSIESKAIDTEYQITDYLPAGLKLLTSLSSRNLPYDQLLRYPYEVNGQAVKFWSGKSSQEFHYYALVTGKGTFTAEAPTVQGFVVPSSVNYGTSTSVTIQ